MSATNARYRLLIALGVMPGPSISDYPLLLLMQTHGPVNITTFHGYYEAVGVLEPGVRDNLVIGSVMRKKKQLSDSPVLHEFIEVSLFRDKAAYNADRERFVSVIFERSADLNSSGAHTYTLV
jgi:hypothetical protein